MFGSHNLVRGEANAVLSLRFLPVSKSQGSLTSASVMFRQRVRHRTQYHVAFHCPCSHVSKFAAAVQESQMPLQLVHRDE